MSTPTPVATTGQAILTLIESDALTILGKPILTFLTQVQAANGDPLKEGAAWIQLQGGIVGAAPEFIGGLESQLAALLAAKLQSKMAAAAAKPA